MKWLWWAPDFKGPFKHKPKSAIAPIYNSLEELIEKRSKSKNSLYWHSEIDRRRGSYFGSTYYYPYFLDADLAVDVNIEDFNQYDGIIISELITYVPYLRKTRRYEGIIVAVPRMPPKKRLKREEIDLTDLCLMGFETPMRTIKSLNLKFNTDKWNLLPLPPCDIEFLRDNFYTKVEDKTDRVISYRVSSGYPSYPVTLKETAKYLVAFQGLMNTPGYMTSAHRESIPAPFLKKNIPKLDNYYRFIAQSKVSILASATGGSISTLSAGCGTLCVGSNETTVQRLLFPDLSFPPKEYTKIAHMIKKCFKDKKFYEEEQKKALENLMFWFKKDMIKKSFYNILNKKGLI